MTDADGSALADSSACPLHVAVLGRASWACPWGAKPLATSESDRPRWRGLEGQPARAYRHRLGRAPEVDRASVDPPREDVSIAREVYQGPELHAPVMRLLSRITS